MVNVSGPPSKYLERGSPRQEGGFLLESILENSLGRPMNEDQDAKYRFDRPEYMQIESAKIVIAHMSPRRLYFHYERDKKCPQAGNDLKRNAETCEWQEIIRIWMLQSIKPQEIGEEGEVEIKLDIDCEDYSNIASLKIYSEPTYIALRNKIKNAEVSVDFKKAGKYRYGAYSGHIMKSDIRVEDLSLLAPLTVNYMIEKFHEGLEIHRKYVDKKFVEVLSRAKK